MADFSQPSFVATLLGAWLGGTAPDWLELRIGSRRLLPHRRLTHWLLGWTLALAAWLYFQPAPGYAHHFGLGFLIGGVTHCLVDFPNPMGIPVLHPWNRSSLNWWKSGKNDLTISFVFLFCATAYHKNQLPIMREWATIISSIIKGGPYG